MLFAFLFVLLSEGYADGDEAGGDPKTQGRKVGARRRGLPHRGYLVRTDGTGKSSQDKDRRLRTDGTGTFRTTIIFPAAQGPSRKWLLYDPKFLENKNLKMYIF